MHGYIVHDVYLGNRILDIRIEITGSFWITSDLFPNCSYLCESISVSDDLKIRLNQIMKPGESYEDVIAMLLEEHQEEESLCEGWASRAKEAIEEFQRGETLTEAEIMRKYGITWFMKSIIERQQIGISQSSQLKSLVTLFSQCIKSEMILYRILKRWKIGTVPHNIDWELESTGWSWFLTNQE